MQKTAYAWTLKSVAIGTVLLTPSLAIYANEIDNPYQLAINIEIPNSGDLSIVKPTR